MPGMRVHNTATLGLMILSVPVMYYFGVPADKIGFILIGISGEFILSPDLDLGDEMMTAPTRDFGKLFGKTFGKLYWAMWWPYARIIPHRSFFSHSTVIGTAIRLAYLILCLTVLLSPLGYFKILSLNDALSFGFAYRYQLFLIFLGLCLADLGHVVLDMTIRSGPEHHKNYRHTKNGEYGK